MGRNKKKKRMGGALCRCVRLISLINQLHPQIAARLLVCSLAPHSALAMMSPKRRFTVNF